MNADLLRSVTTVELRHVDHLSVSALARLR